MTNEKKTIVSTVTKIEKKLDKNKKTYLILKLDNDDDIFVFSSKIKN